MQLSDLVGQYHNVHARPEMTGTKGIKKLVSTLHDMKSGNIFEGTVNSVKGQKVTLGLPNGQELSARMEGKVDLKVGQSMFFQVKSNDGTQIAIRPYTVDGSSMNLTLMEALKSANLVVDGRNLSMVNAMMEEQLSIGRESVSQMARLVAGNPDIDVKTIVQMQKLDFPINTQMAAQFENYQTDKQAISQALSDFMDALPDALANSELQMGQLRQTAAGVIGILTEGLPEEIEIPEWALAEEAAAAAGEPDAQALDAGILDESAVDAKGTGAQEAATTESTSEAGNPPVVDTTADTAASARTVPENGTPNTGTLGQTVGSGMQEVEADGVFLNLHASGAQSEDAVGSMTGNSTQPPVMDEAFLQAELAGEHTLPAHTLGSILDTEQLLNLSAQLQHLNGQTENSSGLFQNTTLFSGGQLRATGSTAALLGAIKNQLQVGGLDKDSLLSLMSGKEFKALLKDAMEQQWLLKPEELAQKDRVNRLYDKVEEQLNRLENVIRASGQQNENISDLASNIRSNVEFMEQVNQAYTYVQVPLQMSGQSASGELYVYTNKKALAEGKDELSAFLHLDMDNLGPTDVSVKMHGKNVSTNFYFDNDEAFALVQAHVPVLEKRLEDKGYNCSIKVVNEAHKVNFVEDFLKKDQPSKGLVHRYSFDMKA